MHLYWLLYVQCYVTFLTLKFFKLYLPAMPSPLSCYSQGKQVWREGNRLEREEWEGYRTMVATRKSSSGLGPRWSLPVVTLLILKGRCGTHPCRCQFLECAVVLYTIAKAVCHAPPALYSVAAGAAHCHVLCSPTTFIHVTSSGSNCWSSRLELLVWSGTLCPQTRTPN
jgi:hypothetical protein